jgi:GNAT superfamily N-acetyltransferase
VWSHFRSQLRSADRAEHPCRTVVGAVIGAHGWPPEQAADSFGDVASDLGGEVLIAPGHARVRPTHDSHNSALGDFKDQEHGCMVVDRLAAGQGVGGQLLDWAERLAASRGCTWLRLDAWRTNAPLHAYYQRQGFDPVRVVDLSHRGSGALFQRRVRPLVGASN